MGRTTVLAAADRRHSGPGATVRGVAEDGRRAAADEVQAGIVCEGCWQVHPPADPAACPTCGCPRPAGGWRALPYRVRDAWEFVRLLGRGAMGAVFLARDLGGAPDRAGRLPVLAVKVVQRVGGEEPAARLREMFAHEAAATGLLGSSPYFVRVAGYDTGAVPYLAMEYVPWPTLRKHLRAGALSPVRAARLGLALLQAIEVMHFFRVVHRDLKPSNVFVEEEPDGYRVKVADLGVWCRDSEAEPPPQDVGEETTVWGTIPYMSPEQMAGRPVGRRSDLHTVGSILWEAATGGVPFPATGAELQEQLASRRAALAEPPRRPEFMPEGLYSILATALARDPAERYPGAQAMMQALRAFVAETERSGGPADRAVHALAAIGDRVGELAAAAAGRPALQRRVARVRNLAESLRRHVADGLAFDRHVVAGELAAARAELAEVADALEDPYAAARQPEAVPSAAPEELEEPEATVRLRPRPAGAAPESADSDDALAPSRDVTERYEIVRLVGLGGMSKAYEARDRRLDRRVALKLMHYTDVAGLADAQQRLLFAAEARASARLQHPNTARIFDYGVGPDGIPFIVMEYMEGDTLAERLAVGPLTEAEALAVLTPVASALVEAHALGILHRNLKPGRIVLQRVPAVGEVPRVYGFGPPAAEFETLVPQGMLFGTPQYMAPEQVGQLPTGSAADRYALGSILYETVTGAPPFVGPTIVALMAQKLADAPPELPAEGPRGPLSPGLRAVVRALLRPNPEDRPADTAEVAAWLVALRAGQPLSVPN